MATVSRSFCRSLLHLSRATPARRKCMAQCRRPFSITFHQRKEERGPKSYDSAYFDDAFMEQLERQSERNHLSRDEEERLRALWNPEPSEYLTPEKGPVHIDELNAESRAEYETLAPEEQSDYLLRVAHFRAVDELDPNGGAMDEDEADKMIAHINRAEPIELEPRPAKNAASGMGYWAEDEEDEADQVADNDDDWDQSMITSVAENELQLHREIRQYTRAVAWEMPLLAKLAAKEFKAPTLSTPLRFRYTTYLGESHPAARKVVVEFTSQDLMRSTSLTEPQRLKLTKLLGPRYNPHTDTARMSCERFDHAAQNKRYLGDLVGSLITAAKDPADMFEDVPRDDRHAKVKTRVPFPEAWLLNGERVKQLAEERKPQGGKPRIERDAASQSAIADYMAKMPLGKREATWAEQAQKEPEMETVRVR